MKIGSSSLTSGGDLDAAVTSLPAASQIVLTTPRLMLRTYREDDLPGLAELNGDREVVRFLGGRPMTREDSDALAGRIAANWASHGLGMIAVERRADGALLGMAGLDESPWHAGQIEVGWRLAPQHWGQGYATEAGAAWLEHGFGVRRLSRIIAIADADPPNVASIAVMRRLGMTLVHQAELDDHGELFEAVVYAITGQEWITASAVHAVVRQPDR
jgi:RimJ/RimL family protein N-acetyltransferase